jgi:hypothetical protein
LKGRWLKRLVVEEVIEGTTVAVAEEVVEKGQNFPIGSAAHTHCF